MLNRYLGLKEQLLQNRPKNLFEIVEAEHALEKLDIIFLQENKNENETKSALLNFLRDRWAAIRSSFIAYDLDNVSALNSFCIDIANILDPQNSKLLLMPTLKMTVDVTENYINDLVVGQFIVSEDGSSFIALDDLFSRAYARSKSGELPLFVYTDLNSVEHQLTVADMQRLRQVIPETINFEQMVVLIAEAEEFTALTLMRNLRDALKRGDVSHQGTEKRAGKEAFVGLIEFFNIFNQLPSEKQAIIKSCQSRPYMGCLPHSFKEMFDNLLRGVDYGGRHHMYGWESNGPCMYVVGNHFDMIIENNYETLRSISIGRGPVKAMLNLDDSRRQILSRIVNASMMSISQKPHYNIMDIDKYFVSNNDELFQQLVSFVALESFRLENKLASKGSRYKNKFEGYVTQLLQIRKMDADDFQNRLSDTLSNLNWLAKNKTRPAFFPCFRYASVSHLRQFIKANQLLIQENQVPLKNGL